MIPWVIEKDSHSWILRIDTAQYLYRWVKTAVQTAIRRFCMWENQIEDP